MKALLKQIQKELNDSSTPKAKTAALKFVPGATKVYGIRTPLLNELAKKYKDGGFELVKKLWNSGAFEEKLLAAKLFRLVCKKDPALAVKLVEDFSKDISDWAVCDTLGMQSLKPVAKKMQQEIFELSTKLLKSKNLWQRRLSLVILEVFTKDKALQPEIKRRIAALENDEEYYVQKAVLWIKRNFEKGR
jgi:3-methyladenine DNA glycosylase AlkD